MNYHDFFKQNEHFSVVLVNDSTNEQTKISLETLFKMFSARLVDDITTSCYRDMDRYVKKLAGEEAGVYIENGFSVNL